MQPTNKNLPVVFPGIRGLNAAQHRAPFSPQHFALEEVAALDVEGLLIAEEKYGDSWKSRGGVGAFMMLARKWDRLENILKASPTQYDVFKQILAELSTGEEGCLDAVRDLRRYLLLVEGELLRQGATLPLQRDNLTAEKRRERAEAEVRPA